MQSMNFIAAMLLLWMEEEAAFWLLSTLVSAGAAAWRRATADIGRRQRRILARVDTEWSERKERSTALLAADCNAHGADATCDGWR